MRNSLGLATRVLIFFASSPEITLTTAELSRKFEVPVVGIPNRLKPAVDIGLIARRKDFARGCPGLTGIYSAGPVLLAELGDEL